MPSEALRKNRKQGGAKMANMEDARKVVTDFLKKTLEVEDVKVIKETKMNDGWEAEAEVYEESSFIKSLGLPARLQDRHIYEVKLDNNLEIQSYERKDLAAH
ncbi:MAG: gas vesicle protein [Nitrospirae bacterium]|nr:gas vesicle protein [Nitrospirota bacterium]